MFYGNVPGERDAATRKAIASVRARMEAADEARAEAEEVEADLAERQARWVAGDRHAAGAAAYDLGDMSPRERQAVESVAARMAEMPAFDDEVDDLTDDDAALATFPDGTETPRDRRRADAQATQRAVKSVSRLLSGQVVYADEEEGAYDSASEAEVYDDDDEQRPARSVSPDNYPDWDDQAREGFPSTEPAPVQAAPRPAAVTDPGDDGYDGDDRGEYAGPLRASEPPVWVAPDQR